MALTQGSMGYARGSLAFVLLLVLGLIGMAQADSLDVAFEFATPQITHRADGTDRVTVAGSRSWGAPGEPVLPRRTARILLPPGTEVAGVTVVESSWSPIPGKYELEAGQRPYVLSKEPPTERTRANPAVYGQPTWFPAQPWVSAGVQSWRGHRILVVDLLPVRYLPTRGRLSWCSRMTVRVELDPAAQPLGGNLALSMLPADTARLRTHIDNPDVLDDYAIFEPLSGGSTTGILPRTESYDYVLITSEALAAASGMYDYSFQDLLDLRVLGGLTATLVTTEWIYANYDGTRPDGGTDNQTRIRNFVIDAYNTWGTHYVLLGGDGDGSDVGGESGDAIIPPRGFAVDSPWETDFDIPADMYYGCLDGSFDYDADGLYGEAGDGLSGGEVDLLAEVHVGRAAVDSDLEVSDFVAKVLAYESSIAPREALMVGEYLGFGGVADWGGNHKDEVKDGCDLFGYTTVGFLDSPFSESYDVYTLYDRDDPGEDWASSELIGAINSGLHLLNHLGHANNTYVMKLFNSDVDALSNSSYFIGYSQGCYAGAFDNRGTSAGWYLTQDAVSEHLTSGLSGAVAYIANSRYGWGEYNTTDGPSQRFDREFWDAVLGEMTLEVGAANDDSKWDQASYVSADLIGRWCCYELNLFGDPALRIKLEVPSQGQVRLDSTSYTLPDILQATVIDADPDLDPMTPDTVLVEATSTTEGAGEYLTCTESGNSTGVFVGTIDVVAGSAAPDGQLQAADGDSITVTYIDEDDGGGGVNVPRVATALVDDQAPSFAGLETASPGGQAAYLGWSPASDLSTPIHYNIYRATISGGQDFGNAVGVTTDLAYVDVGLVNGQIYYYVVRAEDAAGNEDSNTVELSVTPEAGFSLLVCGCGSGQALVNGVPRSLPWSGEFPADSVVTVLGDPSSGWEFTQWCCDLSTTANPVELLMNRDWWIVANFNTASYTLTVARTGAGSALINGIPRELPGSWGFVKDELVSLEAVPGSEYWAFDSWSGDLTGSENPTSIVMDSSKHVTANFLSHSLDVAVSADPEVVCGGRDTSLLATVTDNLAHSYSMYWVDVLAFDPYLTASFGGGAPEDIALADGRLYIAAGGVMSVYDMYSPDPLTPLGICNLPGYAQAIAVSGNYAYVGTDSYGIQVVNTTDAAHPVRVGSALTLERVFALATVGPYLYALGRPYDSGTELHILDISDPNNLGLVGACDLGLSSGLWSDLLVSGGYAYASDYSRMSVVDVGYPSSPVEANFISGLAANALSIEGMYLYAGGRDLLSVFSMYDPVSPSLVGMCDVLGSIRGLTVSGGVAYAADWSTGLRVFDVSVASAPTQIGLCTSPHSGLDVALAGNQAYVAGEEGLAIVDVSDPFLPTKEREGEVWGHYEFVQTAGRYLFAANHTGGLRVVDLEAVAGPTQVGACVATGVGQVWTCALDLAGDYALATGMDAGRDPSACVFVYDVSDPAHPVHVASWTPFDADTDGAYCPPKRLTVFGDYAFLAAACCSPGIYVFDISDPTNPVEVGNAAAGSMMIGCCPYGGRAGYEGGYAYLVHEVLNYAEVQIVDLRDPTNPLLVSSMSLGPDAYGPAVSLSVSDGLLYVTTGSGSFGGRRLHVFDISDPVAPVEIGTYDSAEAICSTTPTGDLLYVAGTRAGENRLRALNISTPGSPRLVGSHDGEGGAWYGPGVAASASHVCFADYGWGIATFDAPAVPLGPLGTFSPANTVPDPTYTAPENVGDQDLVVMIEAVVTCDGDPSLTEIGSTSLTVTPAALLAVSGSQGGSGEVVGVPVVLDLHTLGADRFAFSLGVTPEGGAAALVEPLDFEAAVALPAPDMVSPSGGTVAVAWLSPMAEPVTGSVYLGEVLVPVPAEAELGSSYAVCLLSAGASLGPEEICASTGECAALDVCVELLVGDIYRPTPPMADGNSDGDICDWGEYNDDELSWGDIITLFDAWAYLNPLPCGAGSHRFHAADSYPLPGFGIYPEGGDDVLSWGDVITTFDRWANPLLPRPWRTVCAEEVAPLSLVLESATARVQAVAITPAAELVVGDGSGAAGTTVRVPVRVELGEGAADRAAFAVTLVTEDGVPSASLVGFESAAGLGTPLVSNHTPGNLAAAWLAPLSSALTGEEVLGELLVALPETAPAGASYRLELVTVGGSLGEQEVAVVAGPAATVTVAEGQDVRIRRFQVPSKAKVGETKTLTFEVENLTDTAVQIEVRLVRQGASVQSWTVSLGGGAREKMTAAYTFTAADRPTVTLTVEAVLAGDVNPEDNTVAETISVR